MSELRPEQEIIFPPPPPLMYKMHFNINSSFIHISIIEHCINEYARQIAFPILSFVMYFSNGDNFQDKVYNLKGIKKEQLIKENRLRERGENFFFFIISGNLSCAIGAGGFCKASLSK